MKILSKFFLSIEAAIIMLIIFTLSIAAATFIENDFGTEKARTIVYNARWFEILIILIGINLVVNVLKHRIWCKGKRSILLFHSAFIFIIIGAGITRYTGCEGLMHIREGKISDTIISESSEIQIPFALKLVDFKIDRYPGSNMPSSFTSEVVVLDKKSNVEKPYRIYMNHILKYGGFRFFQHSYDEDEAGTILSVNRDPGTSVTYIGYILLAAGLLGNLINPRSRFRKLGKMLAKVQSHKSSMVVLLFILTICFSAVPLFAQSEYEDAVKVVKSFNYKHSRKFGGLLLQDNQGRIKPINTFAYEILNKIARSDKILDLHPDQVILGMLVKPEEWQKIKIIRIEHPEIKKILGIEPDRKYASFNEFFEIDNSGYKLASFVGESVRKPLSIRNKFDKEIIKVNERVNIIYMITSGYLYRIFPKLNDADQKWVHYKEAVHHFPLFEAQQITKIMRNYFSTVNKAIIEQNWEDADYILLQINDYQQKYGATVVPTMLKQKVEIILNETKVFKRLISVYILTGFLLITAAFIKIFRYSIKFKVASYMCLILLVIGFTAHTAGLILRWYISGHAPWTNGYETMIYIAWAAILAGFILSKREPMPLAATSILAGVVLFAAHLSWMDPQITNLVPVLKSYWLMLHVSVITASYGFFGLSTVLAFITLLMFVFKNKKSLQRTELSIEELTIINERTLIIGLTLMTIGTFLGAVWANESWGRFWGWDPKETWSLITIIVYAVVIHLRLILKINSKYIFNVTTLLAFTSILMTYFGVNYYLSGLHSYAQGDPLQIPKFVYFTVAVIGIVIVLAYRKRRLTVKY